MSTAYIAWQDPASRRWFPVGKLSYLDKSFQFVYVQGSVEAFKSFNFPGLQSFPDPMLSYESSELFPVFANRLLSPSRPEYTEFVEWMGLPELAKDPVALLARSGGVRATDALQVFAPPSRNAKNQYEIHFFVHGIRYQKGAEEKTETLKPGDRLELVKEDNNQFDRLALKVMDDTMHLGYCPRYLVSDFRQLLETNSGLTVEVEKVNPSPIPIQYRLLCRLVANCPNDFEPLSSQGYRPLSEIADQQVFSKLGSE